MSSTFFKTEDWKCYRYDLANKYYDYTDRTELVETYSFWQGLFHEDSPYSKNKTQNDYSLLCTEQLCSWNSCLVSGMDTETKNLAEMDMNLHSLKARKLLNWQFTQRNLAYQIHYRS